MSDSVPWDQRYREGADGWELGRPAPPLEQFLRTDPRRPLPPGRVLVPGCGRGHEAALLAELGFRAIGLDFSAEAIARAQELHGADRWHLCWLQADLFDEAARRLRASSQAACRGCWSTPAFAPLIPLSAPPTSKR